MDCSTLRDRTKYAIKVPHVRYDEIVTTSHVSHSEGGSFIADCLVYICVLYVFIVFIFVSFLMVLSPFRFVLFFMV